MTSEYLATSAVAITKHDTTVQPKFAAIHVGVGGDVKVKDSAGNTVTFKNVPSGSILPLANVELIYATDTSATDLVGLRSGIGVKNAVLPSCAYPFTMTNAQAVSLGRDGVWPTVGQAATYTVEGGLGTQKALLTGSDLDAVQTIDTTTGIKAVRFRLVAPSISSIGGVGVSVLASISGAGLSGGLSLALLCSGSTRTGYVEVDGSTVFNAPGAPETNEFFAVFDSTASTIYLYLGDTLFYSGAYTPLTDARIFMQVVEYAGLSAPDIGKEYTLEVFTAATDIMAAPDLPAYPSGATDICGNQL